MTSERTKVPARPQRPDMKLVGRIALGLGLFALAILALIMVVARQ